MTLRQTKLFGKVTKPANKKCDVKGGGGEAKIQVNVIVTLRSAKVVWKCPLIIINYTIVHAHMQILSAHIRPACSGSLIMGSWSAMVLYHKSCVNIIMIWDIQYTL